MRKSLWIIITVLLVAIGAPNAYADSYTPTFTCIGTCGPLPTAPNVSFPSPTTIVETWNGYVMTLSLPSADKQADQYSWLNSIVVTPISKTITMGIFDGFTASVASKTFLGSTSGFGAAAGGGYLTFSAVYVPEPSTLLLLGFGLVGLGLFRKR